MCFAAMYFETCDATHEATRYLPTRTHRKQLELRANQYGSVGMRIGRCDGGGMADASFAATSVIALANKDWVDKGDVHVFASAGLVY